MNRNEREKEKNKRENESERERERENEYSHKMEWEKRFSARVDFKMNALLCSALFVLLIYPARNTNDTNKYMNYDINKWVNTEH